MVHVFRWEDVHRDSIILKVSHLRAPVAAGVDRETLKIFEVDVHVKSFSMQNKNDKSVTCALPILSSSPFWPGREKI